MARRPAKLKSWSHVSRRRNVAAGYLDEEGIFHPLRASYDYSASRAGEGGRKKGRAKGKKKRNPSRARRITSARLKNFTGTITRKRNGQVVIKGRSRK